MKKASCYYEIVWCGIREIRQTVTSKYLVIIAIFFHDKKLSTIFLLTVALQFSVGPFFHKSLFFRLLVLKRCSGLGGFSCCQATAENLFKAQCSFPKSWDIFNSLNLCAVGNTTVGSYFLFIYFFSIQMTNKRSQCSKNRIPKDA